MNFIVMLYFNPSWSLAVWHWKSSVSNIINRNFVDLITYYFQLIGKSAYLTLIFITVLRISWIVVTWKILKTISTTRRRCSSLNLNPSSSLKGNASVFQFPERAQEKFFQKIFSHIWFGICDWKHIYHLSNVKTFLLYNQSYDEYDPNIFYPKIF